MSAGAVLQLPVECVANMGDDLGESPVWAPANQSLYWADINRGLIHCLDYKSGAVQTLGVGEPVGSFALAREGGFVAGLKSGVWQLDGTGGKLRLLAHASAAIAHQRLNDGRCDPQGRFWVGAMDESRQRHDGNLYFLDADGGCTTKLAGISISNGLAWSPDGRWMHHADTPTQTIAAYPYDGTSGAIGEPRVFHRFEAPDEKPDGAAFDSLGRYWVALYGAGRVTCLSPSGERLFDIPVPCRCPTMVAFAGPDFKTLFVTSARQKRSAEELELFPLSGAVFAIRVDTAGLPEPVWNGVSA
ncbi:MAG TPA: SMP-30/gluconolactonase/LRE family protein [Polaromonas sp.]|uniref:SMP-30/gluconolactonase/LRE family protein n=1 Tax=Polaromonas sp. TaxID=1869339 RepID=UPI002D56CD0B|nr:SMP-30/gluconolactonase/LRE family protein [Polaromonas sp.]HYW58122.1 SMP-30/gluconolactonase/LRE family protein [Polaromonas sp.]